MNNEPYCHTDDLQGIWADDRERYRLAGAAAETDQDLRERMFISRRQT